MSRENRQLLALLVITFFAFWIHNGVLDANIMEARNLVTAREILQHHNWLVPTMNGELRLEKPPLPTWITAIMMQLFGQDSLAILRIPAALSAMLLVFFLFKLTKELTRDEHLPLLAGGTVATSFYIFFMARTITWDIFCHSFMLGAIWMLYRGWNRKEQAWKEFIWAGILMGLSFLSKGPVSFFALLLPFLIAFMATYGFSGVKLQWKPLMLALGILLVFSTWWPLYIYLLHPEFSTYVAEKESTAWMNRSVHPWYHYWSFPVQSGIWALPAAAAVIIPYARKKIGQFGNYKFLAMWVWAAVILLSSFPEKKERYLMPVLIPLALITAYYFRYLMHAFKEKEETKADNILYSIQGYLVGLVSFALPLAVMFHNHKFNDGLSVGLQVLILLVFWAIGGYVVRSTYRKKAFRLWSGTVVLILAFCLLVIPSARNFFQKNLDYRSYNDLRHLEKVQNMPFYFNGAVPGKFIQVVWSSGHLIQYWDTANATETPVATPLVVMTYESPQNVFSESFREKYDFEVLGHYDLDMKKKDGIKIFSNYVTIIRKKQNMP